MVIGGGVFHNAILLPMDGDRLLKLLGPGLLSGALTPGERPSRYDRQPIPRFEKKGGVGISVITLAAAFFFLQGTVDPEELVGVPEIERESLFSTIVLQPRLPVIVWIRRH